MQGAECACVPMLHRPAPRLLKDSRTLINKVAKFWVGTQMGLGFRWCGRFVVIQLRGA